MIETAFRGNTKPIYKGVDYTGKAFGSWTVLGPIECVKGSGKNYKTKWLCQCSCGSEQVFIAKENLIKGLTSGCKECYSLRHSGSNNPNWRGHKNIPMSLITHIKYGAKSRGFEYNLTEEYLNDLWVKGKSRCSVSGVDIEIGRDASLDRIDSMVGYIKGNVQWVHKDINRMKSNISQERFIELCQAVSSMA
jgi:hypothetical protein